MSDTDLITNDNKITKSPDPESVGTSLFSDNNNSLTSYKEPNNPPFSEIKPILPKNIETNEDYSNNDNGSVLVIILQCETKPCDNNINKLKWVFSDPYFIVQVCAIDNPTTIPYSKTLSQSQYLENYYMRKTLIYAAEGPYVFNENDSIEPQFWWSKIPCIIIKDSSISNITPFGSTKFTHSLDDNNIITGMKHRIQVALERAQKADLFFLCKWNDACNKYVDVNTTTKSSLNSNTSSLKWSTQPTSTQAIMYTPKSRDYVKNLLSTSNVNLSDLLNTNISQGNLLATVFVPNLIDFDIDLATSTDDYIKLNECAPVPSPTNQSTNTSSYVWLLFIIIAMILVAWILIQIPSQLSS